MQFRQGAGGTWADFSHRGAEVATTLTGLTADTEYQARVQAVNGETPSDWSDASDGVKTNSESNNAPVFADDEVALEVPENSAAGTDVGDPIPEATDADTGDTLTYSLEGTDAASFDFDASTRQITTGTGVTYNHEGKNTYEVKVKAGDGKGRTDTIDVTIDVTDVDEKSATPDRPTLAAVSGSSTSPRRELEQAGAERRSRHHRLQRRLPAGYERQPGGLHARRHRLDRDHHRADGEHRIPGASAGGERRDGQRLVGPLGRGAHECGGRHADAPR